MQHAAHEICGWSYYNKVNINTKKTKEMLLGSVSKDPPPVITINNSPVERVHSFKLLGVLLTSSLSSWSEHITAVCTKASKRLYFLKLLKRSGMTSDDLLYYYKTVIRPVTEFGIQVSQKNSETNWRQYSGKQFRLSFAKKWILIFLPSIHT